MRIVAVMATVIVLVGIVAVAWGRAHKRELTAARQPRIEHERAVRLLDRILAADEVLPSLPSDLIKEARTLITRHYGEKELR